MERINNFWSVPLCIRPDTSDMELPGERLEEQTWGGSKTNVKHSLSGATAVMDNGPGGNKSPYIPNH